MTRFIKLNRLVVKAKDEGDISHVGICVSAMQPSLRYSGRSMHCVYPFIASNLNKE